VPPPREEIEAFLAEHSAAVPSGKIRASKSMEAAMKAIIRAEIVDLAKDDSPLPANASPYRRAFLPVFLLYLTPNRRGPTGLALS
jgi:hypothetical protein